MHWDGALFSIVLPVLLVRGHPLWVPHPIQMFVKDACLVNILPKCRLLPRLHAEGVCLVPFPVLQQQIHRALVCLACLAIILQYRALHPVPRVRRVLRALIQPLACPSVSIVLLVCTLQRLVE